MKKRKKPEVETGFFEAFLKRLMSVISSEFETSEKREKPAVPDGFFENFSTNLMSKIEELEEDEVDNGTILGQLKLRDKPEIPAGYFEQFEVKPPAKPTSGRVIRLRYFVTATSVAAIFALFFLLYQPNGSQGTMAGQTAAAETEDLHYDEYLTYMSEADIIDYMIENDIDLDEGTEETEEEDELFDFYGSDFDILLEEM